MTIVYKMKSPITPEDALDIYERSGLRRPHEVKRVENMLRHANVIVTAWDGNFTISTILRGFPKLRPAITE